MKTSDKGYHAKYRIVASTEIPGCRGMTPDEFLSNVRKAVRDIGIANPSDTDRTSVRISTSAISVELVNCIDQQIGIDRRTGEKLDKYVSRKLVDETETLQSIIASALLIGNQAARQAHDRNIDQQYFEALLEKSPDKSISIKAFLRARESQRLLDLEHKFVYLGGNFNVTTTLPDPIKFVFCLCTFHSRGAGSRYRFNYKSAHAVNRIDDCQASGRVEILVQPHSLEERLLEFAITSGIAVDMLITPIRDVTASKDHLLLENILNPEEIATAANDTLAEIMEEIAQLTISA